MPLLPCLALAISAPSPSFPCLAIALWVDVQRGPAMATSSGTLQVAIAPPAGEADRGTTPPPFYVRMNHISCDPCRKRKLKCDRVKPCATCKRRGIENQCYQEDHEQHANGAAVKRRKPAAASPSLGRGESTDEGQGESAARPASLADALDKCKEQLSVIAQIANQSRTSLDAALPLAALDDGPGLQLGQSVDFQAVAVRRSTMVTWKDVSHHLPSIEECEELITFYFEEVREGPQGEQSRTSDHRNGLPS